MPITRAAESPTFHVPGFRFIGYTAPSRGAAELSTWRLEVEPGARSVAHWIDHEEVFILLEGTITATVAGETAKLTAGDSLAVPAQSLLQLANQSDTSAYAIVCLPAGARATDVDGNEIGTPPWAQ